MTCVGLCSGLLMLQCLSKYLAASGDFFRPSSGSGHEMLSNLTCDTPRGSINPVIEIPWSSLEVPELPEGGTWRGRYPQAGRDHGRCNALPCLPNCMSRFWFRPMSSPTDIALSHANSHSHIHCVRRPGLWDFVSAKTGMRSLKRREGTQSSFLKTSSS